MDIDLDLDLDLNQDHDLDQDLDLDLGADLRQAACAPGDHGDHGTSVSDEIDQKTKNDQNTWFFLRFFPPAHFDH